MTIRNSNTIDDQIKDKVINKVGRALKRGVNQQYVEELRDRIVERTQLGIGFDPQTKNTIRLKPLDDDYKKVRKRSKRLATTTKPAKSNLTATGQLLKSLTVVKIKLNEGIAFAIRIGDRRGRDLSGNSSKIGNKQLVEFLAKQGRTFFGFTKPQRNRIRREIRQFIINFLR